MNKICLVRMSAVGDVILHVPLVRTLQKALPDCEITWVISRACFSLLEGLSGVEFIVIDKPRSINDYWAFRQLFKGRTFDVLLAMQASLRANLLYPWIKAPIKIGFDSARSKDLHRFFINRTIKPGRQHLLDSFLSFADEIGVHEKIIQWDLPVGADEMSWVRAHLPQDKPILAINPAASKQERNWSIENYVEVIRQAQARWQVDVVLTGGKTADERAIADKIKAELRVPLYDFVGQTTLKQLAALFTQVNVLIAPDTGPAHLAVAMGTPVVGLYAVAPPELSAPYLYQDLVVSKFPEAVRQFLQQDPATIPWGTRVHHPGAMLLIQPEDVLSKLALIFEKK